MDRDQYILDDPTDIEDAQKNSATLFLLKNIQQIYHNADQWDAVSEKVALNLKEIDSLLMGLNYSQNVDIKKIRVSFLPISDPQKLATLYDFIQTYPEDIPFSYSQKIYFIEGDISATAVIPTPIDKQRSTIHIELLFNLPLFIQEMWRENTMPKSLSSIPFVKAKDIKKNCKVNRKTI
ncbi:MAG: hypothetical protein ACOX0X_02855 [Candidatus Dojkabacteria bacterium]